MTYSEHELEFTFANNTLVVAVMTVFSYRPRLWKIDYTATTDCRDLHASVTLSLKSAFPHVSTAPAAAHTGTL